MSLLKLIGEQTDVAFTLAKHILTTEAKANYSNVVFSPLSIQALLSLIAVGSKGATLEQLLSFLKAKSSYELASLSSEILAEVFSDGSGSGGLRLSSANGVWVDKSLTLKHSFQQVVETAYNADANQLDFKTKAVEATKEVNAWFEKATYDLIKDILPQGSVNNDTTLVLVNALYFKEDWDEEFDSSLTREHDVLKRLGLSMPFNEGDLTEIVEDSSKGRHLFVSIIYHKAFIEVNEKGIKAASIFSVLTASRMGISSQESIDFVADHPFLFVIREDMTGVVLFIGQCCEPSPTNERTKRKNFPLDIDYDNDKNSTTKSNDINIFWSTLI